ncbi:S49 family peptidase [Myroides odoratimimus]|uniref:S49 family peptidase n=1 Tax=Myroides odoratimimus TaxID=76832 RepID=UPI002577B183|nr:S49 family peptidase [Myroides odoratimimus]MDM1514513.1 S49 family peptidase [Myroides odoratimimus]
MKVNKIALEVLRGAWMLQPEALRVYAPIAHDYLYGNKQLRLDDAKPDAIFTAYNNGRAIRANEDGAIDIPKGSIAVIDCVGVLTKYGDWCTYGAIDIINALQFADAHPNIVGILFNVDGPGGSVAAIGGFVDFGKTKTKPVVAICDTACSAHLYVMLAIADYIIADNNISATIGSIGVMLSWVDNRKLLEDLGYVFHEVYPDESQNKNEAFRLAMEGNYDMIKAEMLSPAAIQFQNFVKEKRPNLKADHPGLLTGKTFGADEAVKIGLIDKVGSREEAINMIYILSEIKRK